MEVTDTVTEGGGAAHRAKQAIEEYAGKTPARAGGGR